MAVVLAVLCWGAGCQRTTDAQSEVQAGERSPFGRDVARLCFSLERSGAVERPEAERWFVVADWLSKNLESEEGRQLMIGVAQAARPADKVRMLDEAAARVRLPACPLARSWSGPG